MKLCKNIFAGKTTLDNAHKDQSDILNEFIDFKRRNKPRNKEKKLMEILLKV